MGPLGKTALRGSNREPAAGVCVANNPRNSGAGRVPFPALQGMAAAAAGGGMGEDRQSRLSDASKIYMESARKSLTIVHTSSNALAQVGEILSFKALTS